jgi:hypothetical protein
LTVLGRVLCQRRLELSVRRVHGSKLALDISERVRGNLERDQPVGHDPQDVLLACQDAAQKRKRARRDASRRAASQKPRLIGARR